jgi:hypothetical protein
MFLRSAFAATFAGEYGWYAGKADEPTTHRAAAAGRPRSVCRGRLEEAAGTVEHGIIAKEVGTALRITALRLRKTSHPKR